MAVTEEKVKISLVDAFSKGLIDLNDQLGKNEKRLEGVAGAAKVAASGMLALGGASIVKMLKDSAGEYAAAVNDIMDKTNMEGEAASRLLAISSAVGLSNEDMGNAIMKMSKSASTAREQLLQYTAAGQASTDIFSKWGVTIVDENNNLLSAEDILRNVTARHREMANGTAKNAMEMEIFGKSGGKMNDMLNLTDERMNQFIDNAKRAGLIISSELSDKWETFDQDTRMLETSLKGLKVTIGNELLPQFISLSASATDVINSYGEMDDETKKFIATCVEASAGLAAIGFAANTIIWLSKPFVAAVGAMELSLGGFALAALPVIAALAAINKGYEDWRHAEAGGEFEYNELGQVVPKKGTAYTSGSSDDYDTLTAGFDMYADDLGKSASKSTYNGGSNYATNKSAADSAAKKAETDYKRMVERYNKLLAELNTKMVDETGSEFDKVVAKTDAEIAKMQEDVVKIQAQGIDTSELEKRIELYRQIMAKTAEEARRDEQIKLYQDTLARSELMVDLELATNDQVNAVRMQQLEDYEEFLRKELESTELNVEDRLALERKLAEAIKQQEAITAQTVTGGWKQALDDLGNYYFDFADHFSGMFDSVESSLSSMFDGMVDDNKSITDSIVDSWEDVGKTIQKAIYKAAMEILVVKPLFSWLGSVLGNIGGGSGVSAPTFKAFASGGVASGWSIVGEEGPELVNFSNPARVYNANQTQNMLSGSAPNVNVIVNNNSGQEMKANSDVKFNGKEYVVNIVLDSLTTNYGGMRDVVAGVR